MKQAVTLEPFCSTSDKVAGSSNEMPPDRQGFNADRQERILRRSLLGGAAGAVVLTAVPAARQAAAFNEPILAMKAERDRLEAWMNANQEAPDEEFDPVEKRWIGLTDAILTATPRTPIGAIVMLKFFVEESKDCPFEEGAEVYGHMRRALEFLEGRV